jgi:glycosyltransferase involved in cell wall biosynthesis
MKILQVINSLATGGAEKLLLESVPIYQTKNSSTDLLLLNGNNQPFLQLLEEKNCCSILKLATGSVYNPMLVFKIIPFLKKYDIIHVHLFPALYWVAIAKMLSFSNVKLVYTEHSTNNRRREKWIFKILDKVIYSKYNAIIAISNEVSDNLNNHIDNQNISIIENGLNLAKIKEAKPYLKSDFFKDENAFIVIQVARFYEPKDHKTVIKAIGFLPENVKLILIGDGVLKQECEALSADLNLQNRIQFLGLRTDVLSLLKTADVVVLSSKYEGQSLSCIEGMASGKPFVATNVPGLKEMVKNAGILFELGNEKQLAEVIQQLMTDKDFYNKTVQNCQSKSNQYDINVMIDKTIQLYSIL